MNSTQPRLEDLLPGIEAYLEENSKITSLPGLEDLVLRVRAKTGLEKNVCVAVICLLFTEIRNSILRDDIITVRNFGRLYVASPTNTKNKKHVFPKYVPSIKIINSLKE